MVILVSMARTERTDDQALSAEARPAARRWLVVSMAVMIPVVLGAIATVALYATHPAPPPSPPAATPALPPSDVTIRDGGTIIIKPGSTNQVRVALGALVEIVLQTGPGQMVMSSDARLNQGIGTSCWYRGSLWVPVSTTSAIRSTASHMSANRV